MTSATPKPMPLTPAQVMGLSNLAQNIAPKDLKQFVPTDKIGSPKPKPRAERSAPVRNPAFREHEGLKTLQKQLNSRPNKNK